MALGRFINTTLLLALLLPLVIVGCSSDDDNTTPAPAKPRAIIESPAAGDTVRSHLAVQFRGSGLNGAGNPLHPDQLSWFWVTVDDDDAPFDSLLGTGESLDLIMPVGDHQAKLVAYETETFTGTSTVDFIVADPANFPPVATIIEPIDGEDYLPAHVRTIFTGMATDREDGDIADADLQWTSSLDGNLGTGSYLESNLSPGTHNIILTAMDSAGIAGADTITVFALSRPTNPVEDGNYYFGNDFWHRPGECSVERGDVMGDITFDVDVDSDTATAIINDITGGMICSPEGICDLTGELLQGNVWVYSEITEGDLTTRLEISIALDKPYNAVGVFRLIETPDGGPSCIHRGRIGLALNTF